MDNPYQGAVVLVALLGILPLAVYLRRRRGAPNRPRRLLVAVALSMAALAIGIGVGVANGAF